MFPGPLIEVNEGDMVAVHLQNCLDIPMTIRESVRVYVGASSGSLQTGTACTKMALSGTTASQVSLNALFLLVTPTPIASTSPTSTVLTGGTHTTPTQWQTDSSEGEYTAEGVAGLTAVSLSTLPVIPSSVAAISMWRLW